MKRCKWVFKGSRGRGRTLVCVWVCPDCDWVCEQVGPNYPDISRECPGAPAKAVNADAA